MKKSGINPDLEGFVPPDLEGFGNLPGLNGFEVLETFQVSMVFVDYKCYTKPSSNLLICFFLSRIASKSIPTVMQ